MSDEIQELQKYLANAGYLGVPEQAFEEDELFQGCLAVNHPIPGFSKRFQTDVQSSISSNLFSGVCI